MRRLLPIAVSLIALSSTFGAAAFANDERLLARLNDEQRQVYTQWRQSRSEYDRRHEAYWASVSARRAERRRKIGAGVRVTEADFVMQQPPKYAGPPLRADIAKLMAELVPPSPDSEITTLPEMLAAAKQHYRFEPTRISEREFKQRYALEALALGLTKEEVTRIYAFETGGRGTFDMQAGINPETKQGRAISTAMGYAQLLAANSIDELVRYGDGFISRLAMLAARPGTPPERARDLTAKIEALRAMMRVAKSVPREWSRHVELSRTPAGSGIHVLNLDGDVGPWLQVIKLKGIKDIAEQAGRSNLSPAELELMNLAGPKTGLEMMEPVGRTAPTANFFSKGAYYRNTIVREKTAAELLAAIDHRMNENMARAGSQEFAAVFDEIAGRGRSVADQRQKLLSPADTRPVVHYAPPRPQAAQPPAPVFTPPAPVAAPVKPVPVAARAPAADEHLAPVTLPTPMRVTPPSDPALIPPMPVRAERPAQTQAQPPAPAPRLQWAPPGLAERGSLPLGFSE